MRNLLIIGIIILTILSCSNNNTNADSNKQDESTNKETEFLTDFLIQGDSVYLPEFQIILDLSEKAQNKLKEMGESIILSASFLCTLKSEDKEDTYYGLSAILNPKIELFGENNIANFKHLRISKEMFEDILDKNYTVLINIFSGRRVDEDNLLDGEFLQDDIDKIKGKSFILKVKLIGETNKLENIDLITKIS